MRKQNYGKIQLLGIKLNDERFERRKAAEVLERTVLDNLKSLETRVQETIPLARDDLQREDVKERTLLSLQVHTDLQKTLLAWAVEKAAFLRERPKITSVADAQVSLNKW